VTPDRARASVPLARLVALHPDAAGLQQTVDELVQARLLTVERADAGGGTVELAHDSLLQGWPTLTRWLEEAGDDAALLSEVQSAARAWQAANRPDELLWRGERALAAGHLAARGAPPLGELERAWLEAGRALEQRGVGRSGLRPTALAAALGLLAAASAIGLLVVRGERDQARSEAVSARLAESLARQQQETAAQAALQRAQEVAAAQAGRAEAEQALDRLNKVLTESERARVRAAEARVRPPDGAEAQRAAEEARARAEHLARQLQENLEKERARVRALEETPASPGIDTLK
jgi:hypothetical protein